MVAMKKKYQIEDELERAEEDFKEFSKDPKPQIEFWKKDPLIEFWKKNFDKWIFKYLWDMRELKINILRWVLNEKDIAKIKKIREKARKMKEEVNKNGPEIIKEMA